MNTVTYVIESKLNSAYNYITFNFEVMTEIDIFPNHKRGKLDTNFKIRLSRKISNFKRK